MSVHRWICGVLLRMARSSSFRTLCMLLVSTVLLTNVANSVNRVDQRVVGQGSLGATGRQLQADTLYSQREKQQQQQQPRQQQKPQQQQQQQQPQQQQQQQQLQQQQQSQKSQQKQLVQHQSEPKESKPKIEQQLPPLEETRIERPEDPSPLLNPLGELPGGPAEDFNVRYGASENEDLLKKLEIQPNLKRVVIILAYQRTGSSVTGHLFASNQEAFYVYEPVDSIYNAIYGTTPGWNVPSDIFSHKNGSLRVIPRLELASINDYLSLLLQCQMDDLPTEMLIHDFWNFFSRYQSPGVFQYRRCLSKKKVTLGKCRKRMRMVCPIRFGQRYEKQVYCGHAVRQGLSYTGSNRDLFHGYHLCLSDNRRNISQCVPKLSNECTKKSVRVIKTVRMTMESAAMLVERFAQARVIHLIRDPRAVALSRLHTTSFRGIYSGLDPVKEAKLYCEAAVRDIKLRQQLQIKFPGRFMQLVYEDFMKDPVNSIKNIYSFLELSIPDKVMSQWRPGGDHDGKNSTQVVNRWKHELALASANDILDVCREFYENANYTFS